MTANPPPPGMIQAISFWQPYATLAVIGAKPWETRHWCPQPWRIGRRMAIHAARRAMTSMEWHFLDERAGPVMGGRGWADRLVYGAVLGTAVLAGAYRVTHHEESGRPVLATPRGARPIVDDGFGDYSIGRWCWELTDVEPIKAVPMRGRQSWFWFPEKVAA